MADPVESARDELYGGPLDDFVARRNALAKNLALADRKAAAEVRELSKPTVAAWMLNQLARHQPAQAERVRTLGEALRDATSTGDAAALRGLSVERRRVIRELRETAVALAARSGAAPSPAAEREVEQSLQAAIIDPRTAAELLDGAVTGPLRADPDAAFGDGHTGDAWVAPGPDRASRTREAARADRSDADAAPKVTRIEAARAEKRRRMLEQARTHATRAADALERASGAVEEAVERENEIGSARDQAEAELTRLRGEVDRAEEHMQEAESRADRARQDRQRAQMAQVSARKDAQAALRAVREAEEAERHE